MTAAIIFALIAWVVLSALLSPAIGRGIAAGEPCGCEQCGEGA